MKLKDFESDKLKEFDEKVNFIEELFEHGFIPPHTKQEEIKSFLSQTLKEYRELILENMPKKVDDRPEITEWMESKNRDEAEGFNKAIDQMESLLE